jgi:hypothetical protein
VGRVEAGLWMLTGPHRDPSGLAGNVWKWQQGHPFRDGPAQSMSGGVLLSHSLSVAVPSALKGLTSGFGMGPGVSPSPWPP